MTASEQTSALRRKLRHKPGNGAERTGGGSGPDRTALRALRLALARTSRKDLGLRMDVIGATQSCLPQEDLPPLLPDDHLLLLLEGPGGVAGALALERTSVAAITCFQTTGRVAPDPPAARAFTDTDAALCAPLFEAALAAAASLAGDPADRACLDGLRFGARAEDGKSLALCLPGDKFRVFELRIDIEAGLQQSVLALVVPDCTGREKGAGAAGGGGGAMADGPAGVRGPNLGNAALNATVQLNAVLCRIRLGFDRLTALQVGDLLPLEGFRVDRTELLSASGRIVATGRLGRVEGLRAVRVNETAAPDSSFAMSGGSELTPDRSAVAAGEPVARASGTEKAPLDQMNPDEAMARISELAGLDLEDEAVPLEHVE